MDMTDVDAIRKTISLAQEQEAISGHLSKILRDEIPSLHGAIRLPDDSGVETLLNFVTRYIQHVPDFLEAIETISHQAGIHEQADSILNIARDYFLKPPEVIEGHTGMDALLDEAYLAHRLMEEVNDRFIGHCGIPLAPMDMTRANLIVHHLIGEDFANELDEAVQYSVELLLNRDSFFAQPEFQNYITEHRLRGWSEELTRWPCLADHVDIDLEFSNTEEAENTSNKPAPSNVVNLH
jgi:hypothetical protein